MTVSSMTRTNIVSYNDEMARIVEGLPDGVFRTDRDGKLRYLSGTGKQLLGLERGLDPGGSDLADILLELNDRYEIMMHQRWQGHDYYAAWFEKTINNARLALFSTYEGGHCAFQSLMEQADGNIYKFHNLAEDQAKLPKNEREKWLNKTCPVIASASKL